MADPAGAPFLLEMRGIRKVYPGVVALDGVDFTLHRGEVHVLLGENGAGKSTLMKVLSGATARDAGTVLIGGSAVEISGPRAAQGLGIQIIYQEFNLVPQLSAAENIFLGREPQRWPGVIDRRRLHDDAQRLLAGLGMRFDPRTPVSALGVAAQQMVEVARALSVDARILVMDEPTSALTESEIEQLFRTIVELTRAGVGVIYISHRMEELARIGHRVTVLRDGRHIRTTAVGELTLQELIRLMANRDVAHHFPPRTRRRGEEVLRVEGLSRGARVRDVGFALHRGEIVGVAGLLGAGRTELARTIFGAEPAAAGRIVVKGRPLRARTPRDAIRAGVGLLPEDRKQQGLLLRRTVRDNLALPTLGRLARGGVVDRRAERALAERWIRDLRVKTPGTEELVLNLSGGTQQKIVLGKWLAAEADVLIVDEPTRGIDVAAKMEIYQLLDGLAARGAGILLISSDLPEILGMSDRILVMHEGRIRAELDAGATTQEEVLHAALGLAS